MAGFHLEGKWDHPDSKRSSQLGLLCFERVRLVYGRILHFVEKADVSHLFGPRFIVKMLRNSNDLEKAIRRCEV
jgi:hypothetical protein